jgi:hypothetical protein
MADEPVQNAPADDAAGPQSDIQRPAQYPSATRIENGIAYDISGKPLGPVSDSQAGSQSAPPKPKFDPSQPVQMLGQKPAFNPDQPIQAGAKPKFDPSQPIQMVGPTPVSVSAAQPPQKPGFLARAGLPSTTAELPAFLIHIGFPIESGIVALKDAPQDVKDYAVRTYEDLKDVFKEQNEALQNVSEGGPFWFNLGKGLAPVVKAGLRQIPFVGSQEYTAGEDVANKNYAGAAGGLTAVIAQVVLPEILRGTSEGGRLSSAIKEHANAKTILDGRTGEADVAARQALIAEAKVTELRNRRAAGDPVLDAELVQAQEDASAARANASKAQKALDDAQTARNEAAVKANNLIRQAAVKAQKEEAFHQQVLENQRKAKIKTGTAEEVEKSAADFQKVIPPGVGKAAYTPEDAAAVRPILEKAHGVSPVDSPQGVVDALESDRVSRDNEVRGLVRDGGKYAQEPLLLTDDAGQPVSVKQKLVEALAEDEKLRPGFTEAALKELERFNTTDPTLDEADKLRETLNSENRDKLNTPQGKRAISDARETDPEFAARYELQDILRDGIYSRLEEKGVKNARESRQLDASVIRVKNAALKQVNNADKVLRGSSDVGAFRKGAAKISTVAGAGAGWGAGAATGIPLAPEVGAVVGGGLGKALGEKIAPPDLTRGEVLKRSLDVKHPPREIPRVDASGSRPSAPPAGEPVPVPRPEALIGAELERAQGEFTPLHADLATHYGETMGDTPYAELEDRFLADVAIKKQYRVPLDPAEKKLLNGINQAKVEDALRQRGVAEEQKKAAQKAADEAEKKKQDKLEKGVSLNIGPPFDISDTELPVPSKYAEMGYTGPKIRAHELGHLIMTDYFGHGTQDIISHLHDDIDKGALAEARWDRSQLKDESGKFDVEKMRGRLPELVAMLYGGPVAEELVHGTPVHNSYSADVESAKGLMKVLGVKPAEQGAMLKTAELDARKVLTNPDVIDIIKKYTDRRQAGLDDGLHMDPETIGAAIREVRNAGEVNENSGNNKGTSKPSDRLGKESQSERAGGISSSAKETVRPTGEEGEGARSGEGKLNIGQGGHAGGGVASVEELSRPGRFVKISRSGIPTDQGKVPDFNLGAGEAGYQVKPDGTFELKAGQETPATNRGVKAYADEVFPKDLNLAIKDKDAPKITEIIPELKDHPEIEQRLKDLGFEGVLQKEWIRQHGDKPAPAERLPKVKNLRVPPERTTGEYDEPIRKGGAIPGGIQKGDAEIGLKDLALFHDPSTGSTLALPVDKVSSEAVAKVLRDSRDQYIAAEDKKATGKN